MITIPLIALALGAAALPLTAPATLAQTPTRAPAATSVARDSAESLYTTAREALSSGDYTRAAQLFRDLAASYPRSALVPDATYYEAFARYRSGGIGDLQSARALLDTLRSEIRTRFPAYTGQAEANALATRVCGALAQQGDAACAARIAAEAQGNVRAATSPGRGPDGCTSEDDDRAAALNALLQMDADRAMPILEKVLARRDACSASLRRKAIFLVSQKQTPQTVDILVRVAQTDPDPRVREQAVFALSQVPGDRTFQVLSDILHTSSDSSLREKALFALSQNRSPRARDLLRAYAADAAAPRDLRGRAILGLGMGDAAGNSAFLQSLYGKLTDPELKDKVLAAMMMQRKGGDNGAWLLDLAKRTSEPLDARKRALFLASQSGVSTAQIAALYDALPPEMREQAVFVLSQRNDAAAMDKLIAIARSDKDPDARRRAIFWLGQSHDPRATQLLTELLDK